MPITYTIVPGQKTAYVKGTGKVSIEDIMQEGAKMFAQSEWENGYNLLCDYREVTELDIDMDDVGRIVDQDMKNESVFDKSKCAIVATKDLVYGFTRMWDSLSANIRLTKEVFRDINDAIDWLDLDLDILESLERFTLKSVDGSP